MTEQAVFWLVPPLMALVVSYWSVAVVRRWLLRAGVLDHPTARSSHRTPTPRGGGLGMLAGFSTGLGVAVALSWLLPGTALPPPGAWLAGLVLGGGLIALVGLWDDLRPRPASLRLAAQVLGASVAVASIGVIEALRLPLLGEVRLDGLAAPLTVLWIVAAVNIFNFMDGIDGLAAGQAAIACCYLALAALLTGHGPVAVASGCLAAAALGFLAYNFPPASIFMGDAGSTLLGYTFAALAVLGAQPGASRISISVSALFVAPFLFDATLTLGRRVWRGERWYEAHRSHLYQRLVQAGYSHRSVSLLYYLLALALGLLGLAEVATGQGATDVFLLVGLAPLLGLVFWVRRVEAESKARSARMAKT